MAIFIMYSLMEDEPISVWGVRETSEVISVIKKNLKTFKKQFDVDVSKITSTKMPTGIEELIISDFKKANLVITIVRKDDQTLKCTFKPTTGQAINNVLNKLLNK